MNKKDTVVFDLDGTLLDTLEDLKNSVNYAMRHFDYPERTLDEVRRFVGNGIVLLIQRAIPGGKDDPNFEEAFALFKEHYGKHCNDTTKPYEGIMELLHILKEHNIKIAIVSNKADFAVKELNEIYEIRKKDMHVVGEMTIALDKVAQGIYSSKITSNTSNFMVQTLRNIINK